MDDLDEEYAADVACNLGNNPQRLRLMAIWLYTQASVVETRSRPFWGSSGV